MGASLAEQIEGAAEVKVPTNADQLAEVLRVCSDFEVEPVVSIEVKIVLPPVENHPLSVDYSGPYPPKLEGLAATVTKERGEFFDGLTGMTEPVEGEEK